MPSPHSSDSTQDQTEMASSSGGAGRPPIPKRHSSQSSHGGGSSRQITSPGSASEHHPLRHAVGATRQRHKIMLPRNHSSGRNLAKMGKQVQAAQHVQYAAAVGPADEAGKRHARQRSHEGDSEIRLPGSLDESNKPLLRRNVTSHEFPTRNKSSTKLKKNLSHGQLTRLASGKNLVGLGNSGMLSHQKVAPPSPGLKTARKGRAKSEEVAVAVAVARDKDVNLHEQEVELMLKRQERKARNQEAGAAAPRHVGFAVGSADGDENEESEDMDLNETPEHMEGSGLQQQEDEWTDNSASASPLSTRINTANNSRRPSMMAVADKPPDEDESEQEPQHPNIRFHMTEVKQQPKEQVPTPETYGNLPEEDDDEDTEEDMPSPKSMPAAPLIAHEMPPQDPPPAEPSALTEAQPPPPHIRSPLHAAKDYPSSSVAKRLTSAQLPAPALVSNVSALDDIHSTRGSPAPSLAPSLRSTRSITGGHGHDGTAEDQDEQQFISKFLPSSSHPSTGSGANTTAMNTPKMGSFQAPQTLEEETRTLDRAVKSSNTNGGGPASPQSSTRSASSGATTPSFTGGRSRFEMQMLKDKALADREAAAELKPDFPHHKYDRRNESLKSYLNLIALGEKQRGLPVSTVTVPLGPEIFQGRFKAVNVELKVVQVFRDPVAESVRRLRECSGSRLGKRGSPQKKKESNQVALKSSKSAVTLPSRIKPAGVVRPGASKLSTSASPPKMGGQHSPQKAAHASGAAPMAKSAILVHAGEQRKMPRRGVSFAGAELTETREYEREEEEMGPDGLARMLWDGVGV
ncbi:hypothetical protein LTR17_017576 [Elasticomyces elasticus]|nr:hypothetical protein LTR17_017576 [Elasticomyces elasticus]